MFHSHNSIHLHRLISIPNINIMHCLTCAKRREFSGMIHWLTINFTIPATPFPTHPATLWKIMGFVSWDEIPNIWKVKKIARFQTTNQIYNNIYIYVGISGWFTHIFLWFSYGYIPIYSLWYSLPYPVSCFNKKKYRYITIDISPINHR